MRMGGGSEKACFNIKCGATTSTRWRNGWLLRSSGRPVVLCDDCGLKYDQMKFCETFHLEDEGWRTCNVCNKRIHCGCIASAYSFTLVDTGGIECINCASKGDANLVENRMQHPILFPSQKLLDLPVNNLTETRGSRPSQVSDPRQWLQVPNLWQSLTGQSAASSWRQIPEIDRSNNDKSMENNIREQSLASGLNRMDEGLPERIKNKDLKLGILENSCRNSAILEVTKDVNARSSSRIEFLSGDFAKEEGNADDMQDPEPASAENVKPGLNNAPDILRVSTKDNQLEAPASACLNISLGSLVSKDDPSAAVLGLAISSGSPDEAKESAKVSASHPQRQRQRQLLPKALQASPSTGSESSKDMHPQIRVARPPGEGRGRNQLLPRYWPRITDQELQQISGDANSVITPLFEKMLSASDAGRIGRLVLPKACAEVENRMQHPILFPSQKLLDLPVNNLTETRGSRPSQVSDPRQWLQVPNLWQSLTGQSAASSWRRIPEIDRSNNDKSMENNTREQSLVSGLNRMDEGLPERIKNKDLKLGILENSCRNSAILEVTKDVNARSSSRIEFLSGDFAKEEGNADDMQDPEPASADNVKPGLNNAPDILRVSTKDNQLEAPASACLNISLGSLVSKDDPSAAVLGLAISSGSPDEAKESAKVSASHPQRQRQRQLLPKALQASPSTGSESSKDMHPQIRVARPPGEGRGRNQLLPRYWPRITDQELQQISGDANSVITPLFEKMLSASDAGRIGRLVLPKACAEAYFPPISQPEGLPLKIQDAKGKEWIFQFRFWPNNNSRMYVLEGVTPCIQSMQLQAGDTVTFSRLDPEGKLVMGFRKASNSASPQEGQPSTTGNGTSPGGGLTNGNIENLSSLECFSVLPLRSINGNAEPNMNSFAGQLNAPDVGFSWYKPDTTVNKMKESSAFQPLSVPDKRRSSTLGSKSKRLRIDNEDSLELKLTWEEAQDLLRPPPRAVPTIVMIEGHEFEEYEEAPVFGKHTIFTTNQSGEKHQWAQCDECSSWRRLPMEAFLPPRWNCADNMWDPRRAFCSAPQEVSSEELEKLFQFTTGSRKPETAEGQKVLEASSGLDTLANVAALGENDTAPPLAAATTKHPRHRPGCTCIVCIQPPSGKGPKHKPTCTCNVCMTVKRRFKTLMMRRKKRQSEREAENAKKKRTWVKEEVEVNSGSNWPSDMLSHPETGSRQEKSATVFREALTRVNNFPGDGVNSSSDLILAASHKGSVVSIEKSTPGKGQIDLNSHPEREDEPPHGVGRMSMMRLLQDASLPLEMYLKQKGLASLVNPQRASMPAVGFEINASEQRVDEQSCTPPNAQNQEEIQEEQLLTPKRVKSDGTSVSI